MSMYQVTLSPCSDDLKGIQSWEPFPAQIGAPVGA